MQRFILVILLVAVLGVGAYLRRDQVTAIWGKMVARAGTITFATPGPEPAPSPTASSGPASRPASALRDVRPGEPRKAPPGTYYMLQRAKVVTTTGVKAVNPGEQVKLLERLPNNRLRVTVGSADFEVSTAQVTEDLEAAREAERRFQTSPDGSL